MIPQNYLRTQFLYFSKFVSQDVIAKMFRQPGSSQFSGYADFQSAIAQAADPTRVIPAINTFIFSINEQYLSDVVKNASDVILFVEYGKMALNKGTATHNMEPSIAISVASDFAMCNNDVLQELLIQERNLTILNTIIDQLHADEHDNPDFSGIELLSSNMTVQPVDPRLFYGRGGWTVTITQSNQVV